MPWKKSILLVAEGDGHKSSSLEDHLGAEHSCALLQLFLRQCLQFYLELSVSSVGIPSMPLHGKT